MPVPLIRAVIVVVVGLLGLGGIAALIARITRKLAGKRVAILGRQQVGKTSLLHFLRDGTVPDRAWNTVDPVQGGRFSLKVTGGTADFAVPKDLPGNDGLGFADWKQAFSGADYLWYLFRADLIAQGDSTEIEMVKGHLDMFKDWLDTDKSTRPKIILIGTWADQDPRFQQDPGNFQHVVGSASPIKIGLVKLNNAALVVGSLLTDKNASALVKSLGKRL